MLSGTVSYGSYVEGVEFDSIEITSPEPNVQKVEVASDKDGNVSIDVHVGQVANFDEAVALGFRETTRVVNILAFELGRYVRDPGFRGHALTDDSSGGHILGDSIGLFVASHAPIKLGAESRASLTSALSEPTPPGEADYQLVRACLDTKDVASKFLALYRLLGRMADHTGRDRQALIDEVIRRKEPGVGETISPQTGGPETVYSKLRNEHMHRSSVPLARVRSEMATHLPGLISVVKKAIKNP